LPSACGLDISFDTRYNFEIIKSNFDIANNAAIRNLVRGIHRHKMAGCTPAKGRAPVVFSRARIGGRGIGAMAEGAVHSRRTIKEGAAEQKAWEALCWN
jgi:hypothetical protein